MLLNVFISAGLEKLVWVQMRPMRISTLFKEPVIQPETKMLTWVLPWKRIRPMVGVPNGTYTWGDITRTLFQVMTVFHSGINWIIMVGLMWQVSALMDNTTSFLMEI